MQEGAESTVPEMLIMALEFVPKLGNDIDNPTIIIVAHK